MEDDESFSSFIPAATPEKIKNIPWLYPHFAGEKGNLKALVQSFLVRSNGKNILVDTCNGNCKSRPLMPQWGDLHTDYLTNFERIHTFLEEIDIVICTHFHFDHIGWNTRLEDGKWIPTFPHARYILSQGEYDYWKQKPEKEVIDDLNAFDDSITPIVDAGLAQFVDDDFHIDPCIALIPTPGHTPHHMSVVIESEGQKAIITGDVMHHPCQIAHPEWTTLADTYPDQTVETRKKFLEAYADTDTLIIGSHFASPVGGTIIRGVNGFEFTV